MFIPVLCFDLNNYRFFTKSSSETQGQIVGKGKSKRAEKYDTKKSKEQRHMKSDEGLFWKSNLLAVLYFSSCHIFPPV